MRVIECLYNEWLTTEDVALVPSRGHVASRSDIRLRPFIYNAPMDSVASSRLIFDLDHHGHTGVTSRFPIEGDSPLDFIKQAIIANDLLGFPNARYNLPWYTIGLEDVAGIVALEEVLDETGYNGTIDICVDIAHGWTDYTLKYYEYLARKPYIRNIMGGSICTADAAISLVDHGVTHLRVGIGPGSACSTRVQTGIGLPNLSAVHRIAIATAYRKLDVTIVADGGISNPGQCVKYLAAGADAVMLGSVLAKAIEAPGWAPGGSGGYTKLYLGQASQAFQERHGIDKKYAEGVSRPMIYTGETVESIIHEFEMGMRSGCSYLGLETMDQLRPDNIEMVKITSNGYLEGLPK